MSDLLERLDKLRDVIQDPDFLAGRGLNNNVNIRIFCYDPHEEKTVRYFLENLTTDQSLKCHIREYNLYKLFLSICDDRRITDRIAGQEAQKGTEFVLNQLKRIAVNNTFAEKMKYEPHQRGDLVLITGVGEAYPFIRVHALLEALQSYFNDVPILVMYPGSFDGHELRLFNLLKPNAYYRAFSEI